MTTVGVAEKLHLPARPRILVIALRRLGDVLLTTPLIRSLRRAWPDARIEVMVFRGTAAILSGNPDIDRVIESPERSGGLETLKIAGRLFRRYDLAVTTQEGDRPSFYAIAAGRKRAGVVASRLTGRIKGLFLHRRADVRADLHRVEETLLLARALGVEPVGELVAPRVKQAAQYPQPYAVLHAAPFFRYKQWHREGWRAVAQHLIAKGLQVIATGGSGAEERAYLDDVWREIAVQRRDGRLAWPELASLLAGARVFLGPDTSVTHLAAAAGCPTVALFGPTDPRRWGPWPQGGLAEPWLVSGSVQRRGGVFVVQNPLPGMPCGQEGCLRHVHSHSLCLDEMPVSLVIGVVEAALGTLSAGGEGGAAPERPLFNSPSSSIAP